MNLVQQNNWIVNWIKAYAKDNDRKALIIGISGGIDSALTSTLCAQTNLKTIIVSLTIHQNKSELKNAQNHINWLCEHYDNIQPVTIELSSLFNTYKSTMPTHFHSNLGFANTKSRIRMMTLYQIASKENGLVIGTGNKIEDFGIGFFTKYGDGGVDISPIADLTKTEVRELSRFCDISNDILTAAPTDGLWEEGKTDEEQIGASYEELEWAMHNQTTTKLSVRQMEVLRIYNDFNTKNQHKMKPIPICIMPKSIIS